MNGQSEQVGIGAVKRSVNAALSQSNPQDYGARGVCVTVAAAIRFSARA